MIRRTAVYTRVLLLFLSLAGVAACPSGDDVVDPCSAGSQECLDLGDETPPVTEGPPPPSDCMAGHACAAAGALPFECAGDGCCTAMCEQGSSRGCPDGLLWKPFFGNGAAGEPGFCGV